MNKAEIKDLSKHYEKFDVESVSFAVPSGAVVGLIGENGAGKSTVIKSMLGIVQPDGGQIWFDGKVLGQMSRSDRQKISFVLDDTGLPMELDLAMLDKVMRNVYAGWHSERFRELIGRFQLPEGKLLKEFSKGMKMKAAIAVALSRDSELLILDEPTDGLDPVVRDEILGMLYDYNRQEGHAVLISSHNTADLEKLCDYIVYLHRGRVIFAEEKDALLQKFAIYSLDDVQVREIDRDAVVKVCKREYGTDVLAIKEKMPESFEYSKATLDDIMLFYAKGEDLCSD